MALAWNVIPPPRGFRFRPSEKELINDFLKPKMFGSFDPQVDQFVPTIPLSNLDPWDIPRMLYNHLFLLYTHRTQKTKKNLKLTTHTTLDLCQNDGTTRTHTTLDLSQMLARQKHIINLFFKILMTKLKARLKI